MIGDTYDVSRVVVKAVDQNGNRLPYCSEAMVLEPDGAVDVIGPRAVSLIGGDVAFWVRTNGQKGSGKVEIRTAHYGTHEVVFNVK